MVSKPLKFKQVLALIASTDSSSSTSTLLLVTSTPIPNQSKTLIAINTTSQLPIKLNNNFTSWRAQFHALLVNYALLGYIDGSKSCPFRTTAAYSLWYHQDQLLLHAIIVSVSESIVQLISSSKTSHKAWEKLSNLFANCSWLRVIYLKDKLIIPHSSQPIAEYLQSIKSIMDELVLIDVLIAKVNVVIYILNGIGSDFK